MIRKTLYILKIALYVCAWALMGFLFMIVNNDLFRFFCIGSAGLLVCWKILPILGKALNDLTR